MTGGDAHLKTEKNKAKAESTNSKLIIIGGPPSVLMAMVPRDPDHFSLGEVLPHSRRAYKLEQEPYGLRHDPHSSEGKRTSGESG